MTTHTLDLEGAALTITLPGGWEAHVDDVPLALVATGPVEDGFAPTCTVVASPSGGVTPETIAAGVAETYQPILIEMDGAPGDVRALFSHVALSRSFTVWQRGIGIAEGSVVVTVTVPTERCEEMASLADAMLDSIGVS